MSITKPILKDETYAEKMDKQNALLAVIASQGGGISVTSWRDVKRMCVLGLADKVFTVGDQLSCLKEKTITAGIGDSTGITAAAVVMATFLSAMGTEHGGVHEFIYDGSVWKLGDNPLVLSTYGITVTGTPAVNDVVVITETADTLVWDIANVKANEIVLLLHNCYKNIVFCASQALYYAESELAAGTYNFIYTGTSRVQFTLTQAVPEGGQIVFSWSYNTDITTAKIATYPSKTSTTAIESNIAVTVGTGGTQLTTINDINRARYGSNNYEQSAMRQWLNSAAAPGSVWTPKTDYDRPPSWATTEAGFVNGLDADFLEVVATSEIVTAKNTVTDGGGSVTLNDKFFLPSRYEMYAGKENNISEGEEWALYKSLAASPITGECPERIKYLAGAARYYWLRSPYFANSCGVRSVNTSGALNHDTAYVALGAAPACKISS